MLDILLVDDERNMLDLNSAAVAAGDDLLVRVGNALRGNENLHGDECALSPARAPPRE